MNQNKRTSVEHKEESGSKREAAERLYEGLGEIKQEYLLEAIEMNQMKNEEKEFSTESDLKTQTMDSYDKRKTPGASAGHKWQHWSEILIATAAILIVGGVFWWILSDRKVDDTSQEQVRQEQVTEEMIKRPNDENVKDSDEQLIKPTEQKKESRITEATKGEKGTISQTQTTEKVESGSTETIEKPTEEHLTEKEEGEKPSDKSETQERDEKTTKDNSQAERSVIIDGDITYVLESHEDGYDSYRKYYKGISTTDWICYNADGSVRTKSDEITLEELKNLDLSKGDAYLKDLDAQNAEDGYERYRGPMIFSRSQSYCGETIYGALYRKEYNDDSFKGDYCRAYRLDTGELVREYKVGYYY